jgi:hypothetical protein
MKMKQIRPDTIVNSIQNPSIQPNVIKWKRLRISVIAVIREPKIIEVERKELRQHDRASFS